MWHDLFDQYDRNFMLVPHGTLPVLGTTLGHSHAAELLLNFSYGPHHAIGAKGLNPILSYLAVYFSLE
jgi:hypothetical protein